MVEMHSPDRNERWYRRMVTIRGFETRLLELFAQAKLFGTTHTGLGQEAVAVAVMENLAPEDIIFSSHRCHGHYLARFDDPAGLLGELMGRVNGVCGGRGGSQNLCREGFYSSGVQGGYLPIAAGMAYAEKAKGSGAIVVAFLGDGTLGEGVVYEALNLASLKSVPLLLVLEANGYAQSTPTALGVAGSMVGRAVAFGIDAGEVESNDVEVLEARFRAAAAAVRESGRPRMEIVHTYRLGPHSKGDDDRPPGEIDAWRDRDPLAILKTRLLATAAAAIEAECATRLSQVEAEVERLPFARLGKAHATPLR